MKSKFKLPYEPPQIFDIDMGVSNAYAQEKCMTGGSAVGSQCQSGGTATGGKCQAGNIPASGSCKAGGHP
jgi:hypothetical protein